MKWPTGYSDGNDRGDRPARGGCAKHRPKRKSPTWRDCDPGVLVVAQWGTARSARERFVQPHFDAAARAARFPVQRGRRRGAQTPPRLPTHMMNGRQLNSQQVFCVSGSQLGHHHRMMNSAHCWVDSTQTVLVQSPGFLVVLSSMSVLRYAITQLHSRDRLGAVVVVVREGPTSALDKVVPRYEPSLPRCGDPRSYLPFPPV